MNDSESIEPRLEIDRWAETGSGGAFGAVIFTLSKYGCGFNCLMFLQVLDMRWRRRIEKEREPGAYRSITALDL